MAAQPKRKHSTRRKGMRVITKKSTLSSLVRCKNCKQLKKPHYLCAECGK